MAEGKEVGENIPTVYAVRDLGLRGGSKGGYE